MMSLRARNPLGLSQERSATGHYPSGYTIVEVLIFLAVSGALLISAMSLFGGQQRRAQFTQAVREFDSKIQDIINDVSTGFYPNTGSIQCAYDGGAPGNGIKLTSGSGSTQGANSDCIFIGRVIQFAPQGVGEGSLRIYTVAGQRQVADSVLRREPTTLRETKSILIAAKDSADPTPNAFEDVAGSPEISIGKVCYKTCSSAEEMGGIGVFSTFGSYNGNSLQSGTTTAQLAPIVSTPTQPSRINQLPYEFVTSVNEKLSGTTTAWSDAAYQTYIRDAQQSGITICLLSKSVDQHARLKIGGNSSQLITELTFHGGNRASDCRL